ncbi:MAG: metallophosphoesterase [Alphaproteobacteria bacterium]|nr:metallophosphoesterase [Alphaproteobacteria bacterium]
MQYLRPRRQPAGAAVLAAALALWSCGGAASSPAPPAASVPEPTAAPPPEATAPPPPASAARIVAVGDLHADLPAALAVLQLAGVVDEAGRWSGGRTVLVQTGDTTDRGPDSKEVIELLDRLEEEAEAAGGRVVALLGNHEVMNLTGDLRYVSPDDVADFGSPEARAAAFGPQGTLGRWLRERDAVAIVDDTVFVHGGVTAVAAVRGADGLSADVRAAIDTDPRAAVLGPEGPLWYRGYLQAPEPLACQELERALQALGARRMVVGHTTQKSGRVAVRCEGRLLGIDLGISDHYGRHLGAVELVGGDARAIYPSGAVDLPDPG